MRSCRIAGAPDLRDSLPRADDLPLRDVQNRAMSVAGIGVNGGVIDKDLIAVAVIEISGNDNLPVEK